MVYKSTKLFMFESFVYIYRFGIWQSVLSALEELGDAILVQQLMDEAKKSNSTRSITRCYIYGWLHVCLCAICIGYEYVYTLYMVYLSMWIGCKWVVEEILGPERG